MPFQVRAREQRRPAPTRRSVEGSVPRGPSARDRDRHLSRCIETCITRKRAIEWWNGSMATRLNDLNTGHKIVVQQRLHEADHCGDLLSKGGYQCMFAEFIGSSPRF